MTHQKQLVSLWEMQKFNAENIATAVGFLTNLESMVHSMHDFDDDSRKMVAKLSTNAIQPLLTIGLRMTAKKATSVANDAVLSWHSSAYISAQIKELQTRLKEEMEEEYFLHLTAREAALFSANEPIFGQEVATKFQTMGDEFSEICKCLALGRTTAAVFHSLRCLEGGFAALWRNLGVSDPIEGFERNWGNRLKKVEEQIERRWPAKSGRIGSDAEYYDEVIGMLKGMQNPYRNATMHLDKNYNEDAASHIIELVRGFMKKVASRTDENGLPLAP